MIEKITLQQAMTGDDIRTAIANLIGNVNTTRDGLMPTTGYISRGSVNIGNDSEEEISAALDELVLPGFYYLETEKTSWQSLFVISSGNKRNVSGCITQLRATINGLYYRICNSNSNTWTNWVKV